MSADPWSRFTAAQIAEATGCNEADVVTNWEQIAYALDALGIFDPFVQVAAIATTAIETASTFRPIEEYRNADGSIPSYWYGYDGGPDYHGRGYVQLTHRSNYRELGDKLGIDLVNNPDRALEPSIAAWALAYFFRDHGVATAAIAQDWQQTRIRVQGGLAGWDRYIAIVDALNNMPLPEPEAPSDPCAAEKARYDALRAAVAALTDARPYKAPPKKKLLEVLNAGSG